LYITSHISLTQIPVVETVPELVVPPSSTTGVSTGDLDGTEGVGVPVINPAATATVEKVFAEIYNGGALPSVEEVRVLMVLIHTVYTNFGLTTF